MTVRGRVLGDGAPLTGVVVSDGLAVTRTDVEGGFELPGTGRFVMVTTPTGWAGEWFRHADAPDLDFELTSTPQRTCRFAQVTDLHLSLGSTAFGPDGDATIWITDGAVHDRIVTTPEVLGALLDGIHRDEPGLDFVVATGDLTNDGADDELAAYVGVVARSPVRVVSIPGNHDHHQALAAATSGDALPYERFVGPRWFSFDHGGVHVVAIDWFTHRLGFDTEQQDAWLAADLELVAPGTPIVLLSHDQMPAAFFDRLPRRPVVSLSGHWHTDRVVEHAGTMHLNTGPATFGGLDYCPPHYRVVDVGESLAVRTVPEWNGGHLAGADVYGDGDAIVAAVHERLVALDPDTLTERWAVPLAAAVKSTPRVHGDAVIVCTVAGELVCVDANDGRVRWRTMLHHDPLHLWAYVRPLVHSWPAAGDGHDGLVIAGDVGAFAAVAAATGDIRWCRSDLGVRENLTTLAHPVVVDGVLVGTFAGQSPALFGLDPLTGATRWPEGGVHGIYGSGGDLATELPRVVTGGITPDPDGTDVFVTRLGSRVERIRAVDGEVVWSAPFHGWFNPAAPVVVEDAVVATTSTGQVWSYDRATGERRWSTVVSGSGPLPMGSYRRDGASVLTGVLPAGDRLLQPTGDGRVVVLDGASGEVVDAVDLGVPVVAPLRRLGSRAVAVGVDGSIRTFGIDTYE